MIRMIELCRNKRQKRSTFSRSSLRPTY